MLKPTSREKKRYVLYQIISEKKLSEQGVTREDVFNTIQKTALEFLGEQGLSEASIINLPEKYKKNKQVGVLRVNNKYVNQVKTVLGLVKEIKNIKTSIHVRKVSGILKKTKI